MNIKKKSKFYKEKHSFFFVSKWVIVGKVKSENHYTKDFFFPVMVH